MSFRDLPSFSDLIENQIYAASSNKDTCKQNEEHLQPDPRLKHWQEWMKRRKKMHLKLKRVLNRNPGSLLMNNAEELPSIKEQKKAFEYAELVKRHNFPVPSIDTIGVPEEILVEKDVMPRVRNTFTTWKESACFKTKCEEFKVELNAVQEHKPDCKDLCVKGHGFIQPDRTPEKLIENQQHTRFEKQHKQHVEMKINLKLAINDCILTTNLEPCKTRKVYIMYDYDISSKMVATKHIVMKNLGNATIQYYWKAFETVKYFKDIIPQKQDDTTFCFNKNEGLVIPGETRELPIWFKVTKPGVYIDHWEFCTRPSILTEDNKLVIVLHASAVMGHLDEAKETLKKELENSIKNRLIKDNLAYVLSNIQYNKQKPTIYSYNKKEVFEAINAKYDPIHLQPKYEYNKEVVRELQKFYKMVRRKSDPKSWNYNLHELRILTNAKQRNIEIETQKYKHKLARLTSKVEKLPSMPIPKTLFPALSTAKILQEELEAPVQYNFNLNEELERIIEKISRPSSDENTKATTYTQAYLIFSASFNKMESDIQKLKQKMNITKPVVYPKLKLQDVSTSNQHYENLVPVLFKPPLTENIANIKHQPANQLIQDIPVQECRMRFEAYNHGTLQISAGAVKGKNVPNKPPDKVKQSNQKDVKKQEDSDDDGYSIDEHFDPYANVDLPKYQYTEERTKPDDDDDGNNEYLNETVRVSPATLCQYNFNLYVIIYTHLSQAIGNIVEVLELPSFKKTSHPVIKEVEKPNFTKRLIDLKNLIFQENLAHVKAKVILHNCRIKSKLAWKKIEIERQLKQVKSDSSLWSVLQSYKPKIETYSDKPISYPIEIYNEDISKKKNVSNAIESFTEGTSTTDNKADPLLPDFRKAFTQKMYDKNDEEVDLEAYIEKIKSETSVHSLYDFKFSKETQKNIDEHVSDEEHFYYSPSESELSDISIDSEQNDKDCCASKDTITNICSCNN